MPIRSPAADPRLAANTDPNYFGWDRRCPDSSGSFTPLITCNTRYDEWVQEFSQYVAGNNLPTECQRLSTTSSIPPPTRARGDRQPVANMSLP